jgi:translation elongation factor EF-G
MKKFTISLLALLMATISFAQKDLMVKTSDKGLYLDHKVVAKESFFSISRKYNLHPKSIATFNGLDMAKGLQIDQKLRIPLLDTNFSQKGNSGTPVYYKTDEKETLVSVSNKFNKVLLSNLRNWNNISGNDAKEDSKIIIGFLHSKEFPSITINNKVKPEDPVVKTEPEKVVEKPIVKTEPEKVTEKPVVKPEPEKVVEKPTVKPEEKAATTDNGYFKTHFDQQIKSNPITKNETVTAGIFKTTSGWQDAKYYLLIDKVSPGTIVKVINPTNNKAIFAKVLGEMSGIRQNEGLNIRISNAAASALEVTELDKFIVKVNY